MPRQRWSDLSARTRRLLITAAVADATLRVAALIDIKRRPASQIRGRKRVWVATVALINSAGSCRSRTSSSGGVGSPDSTPRPRSW